ncbi:NAD(P) transhydrogenase subunit alpha [Pikeienuella piscinae]|uniref:proton-translocating NAD(P)(+) transhydrogenase n=1 Tax=Pikeienuella piscinae TaxID=2748098 RepID=A0A7M3T652_9RHOB|nr:NAD(P) transhydrogenase subunit alpha [Pikeienuella piscinae]QIE57483.1 NAD(P) transhydrogenase subunit alpha [Pikeienuella piscinae]
MSELLNSLKDAAEAAATASQKVADMAATAAVTAPEGAVSDAVEAAAHGSAISPFVFYLSAFVLACFVGYYVVWSVTPALHTPLMSVTNAISSVIVVGALVAVGVDTALASSWTPVFGVLALTMAAVNIFGGFLVTERMLAMYKKKG